MKTLIVIIVIVVLAVGGYLIYRSHNNKSTPSSNNTISNTTTASSSTDAVTISNFSFNPDSITVKAGTAITFTNNDTTLHTVTADNGKFNQQVSPGGTTTITIAEPGTYGYHCSIHTSMTGTIIVQ